MLLKHCHRYRPATRLLLRTVGKANEAVLTVAPGSGSQSACCSFSAGPHNTTSQLRSADLHYYAKLARLSGLCYGHPEQLAAKLQVEGLQVEAQGQTSFTRSGNACCCMPGTAQLTSTLIQQVVCGKRLPDTAPGKAYTACQAPFETADNS